MTKTNGYRETLKLIEASTLTPQMVKNATTLLSMVTETGLMRLSESTVLYVWSIRTHGTMIKYLARLRAAGVLEYSVMHEQVNIFFLGFGEPSEAGFAPPETRSSASSGASQPVAITQVAPQWAGL
jgi:hypothetical protein